MRERTYEIKIEGVPIIVTKKRMKNMYLRISKRTVQCGSQRRIR